MKMTKLITLALGSSLLFGTACSLDVPDLNNPGLDGLENNPTAVSVGAACTGLLIGSRSNMAAPNGYVSQLGILGRESYNFDGADPRYVGEMLAGQLQAGSPFGGNFWTNPYNNIRLANVTLKASASLTDAEFSPANKAAVRGFINTIYAHDLLIVINAHDTNGAVIDTDKPIVLPPGIQPLGAIVSKELVFAEIAKRLDDGLADLGMAGMTFPFQLSSGYAGFTTPATFAKFNRALRARVAVYMKDYQTAKTALAASFIDDSTAMNHVPNLQKGVYYSFSTKTGDATNGLLNTNIYGHPALETKVQKNGSANDARFDAKIVHTDEPGSVTDTMLMSSLQFTMYSSPESPVPVIRNEELILLKSEVLWFTGDKVGAMEALNLVRTQSGALLPILTTPPSDAAYIDALLYERRYSLMFEGGHRWLDLRRFGRITELELDDPAYVRNVRYPLPQGECNARPGEAACMGGTT